MKAVCIIAETEVLPYFFKNYVWMLLGQTSKVH
jgi:hypothetical protein